VRFHCKIRSGLLARIAASLALFFFASLCFSQEPVPSDSREPQSGSLTAAQASEQDSPLAEARADLDKGMVKQSEFLVRHYLDPHPNSAEAHFLLGLILFREIQEQAKVQAPSENVKILEPADSLSKEERAKASLAEFTAGAKYRKPSAFDLKIVALDYVLLADYMDADKWLTRSVEADPKDSEAWYYLGRTKYNENRFDEAIHAFSRCLALDPRNVKAQDNLGLSYAGLGKNDEAVAAYQQAIAWQLDLALNSPEPYIDYGTLLIETNRPQQAIPLLSQAIQIDPRSSRAHEKLAKAYANLHQLSQAQAEYEAAVALDPGNASLHYLLSQVYRREGFADRAALEMERFSALHSATSSNP
jgi:Flp pilus assembly protein TadD